jgi:hypothetical protein
MKRCPEDRQLTESVWPNFFKIPIWIRDLKWKLFIFRWIC